MSIMNPVPDDKTMHIGMLLGKLDSIEKSQARSELATQGISDKISALERTTNEQFGRLERETNSRITSVEKELSGKIVDNSRRITTLESNDSHKRQNWSLGASIIAVAGTVVMILKNFFGWSL